MITAARRNNIAANVKYQQGYAERLDELSELEPRSLDLSVRNASIHREFDAA